MSVDYYSCECCWDARYEECIKECECCGENICDNCIVWTEWLEIEYYFPEWSRNENGEIKKEHCPLCEEKKFDDANPNKDFLWNALNIWDEVVWIAKWYRCLAKYEIIKFTDKTALVSNSKGSYRVFKYDIIKIN